MRDTHEHDLAGLVESLTPHQRLLLARLVAETTEAVAALHEHPASEWLHRVQDAFAPIQELSEALQGALEPSGEDSGLRPFSVRREDGGQLLVKLSPRILTWRSIWENRAHDWVPEDVERLVIDCGRLRELNSATIAWLVTIAQRLAPGALRLRHLAPPLQRALAVLKLETLLVSEP